MDLIELKSQRVSTAPEFARLAEVPPEAQWFANLDCAQTKRAYQGDMCAFMSSPASSSPSNFAPSRAATSWPGRRVGNAGASRRHYPAVERARAP
jgi:hypothetical protein